MTSASHQPPPVVMTSFDLMKPLERSAPNSGERFETISGSIAAVDLYLLGLGPVGFNSIGGAAWGLLTCVVLAFIVSVLIPNGNAPRTHSKSSI